MKKYQKKPVIIEAVQWNGNNTKEICEFMGKDVSLVVNQLSIPTLEGIMWASIGDFIIKGIQGEFYPCKADIFEQTYEQVEPILWERRV